MAQFYEFSEIPASAEIKFIFNFFMMVPENIGSHNINAIHLHFDDFIFPACVRHPGKMEFAADTEERDSIFGQIVICKGNLLACMTAIPVIVIQREDLLWGYIA